MGLMVAGSSFGQKKALVLYYSQTSNTKAVAQEIAKRTGADIEEIQAVKPYDGVLDENLFQKRDLGLIL